MKTLNLIPILDLKEILEDNLRRLSVSNSTLADSKLINITWALLHAGCIELEEDYNTLNCSELGFFRDSIMDVSDFKYDYPGLLPELVLKGNRLIKEHFLEDDITKLTSYTFDWLKGCMGNFLSLLEDDKDIKVRILLSDQFYFKLLVNNGVSDDPKENSALIITKSVEG